MPADCSINLQLEGKLCVVVGAGHTGRRKSRLFLAAGATVRLIDPGADAREQHEHLEIRCHVYRSSDLEGALLVVAATDRPVVNRRVATDAHRLGLLVCVADGSAASDFTLPAVRQLGDLRLAVSSAGKSPALSGLAADHLLNTLEPAWKTALELAAALRVWQLTHPEQNAYNRSILRQLIDQGLIEMLSTRRYERVDQLLQESCGADCTLAALGLNLPRKYDR